MREKKKRTAERIRQWLREGDPMADGPSLGPDDLARIRAAMLRAHDEPPVRERWRLVVGGAVAAGLVIIAVMVWQFTPSTVEPLLEPRQPVTIPARSVTASDPDGADRRRTIHFVTPGGTRVIWSLNPDFEV